MHGYQRRILRVDLTTGAIAVDSLDDAWARDFIGGTGYATRLLYEELSPQADPLSPGNHLLFMTGPLTGTGFPTASRYQVCTRSPLTGLWVDASSSGMWGNELKHAGYDGILVEGQASGPVYLLATDDRVVIRPAAHLWGLDARETPRQLRRELGDRRLRVACIGPAGERCTLMTSVMSDEGRAAGRGGVGAVMGSKRLKAIAVRGRAPVAVGHPGRLRALGRDIAKTLTSPGLQALSRWGTSAAMDTGWVTGDTPVKNWQVGLWREGCERLGGKRIAAAVLQRHAPCFRCPVRCGRWFRLVSDTLSLEGPSPEYQTLATFGPLLLNDDLETVLLANDLCNRYGLDTVSTGSAIAFAMEAYERGFLTGADTGGLDLAWGSREAIIGLLRQIGGGVGLGALLGQGVRRAAEVLGVGAEEFAVHVKGLEVPMHDPRAFFAMAVNYATGPRGADHMRGNVLAHEVGSAATRSPAGRRFESEGKGGAARQAQDWSALVNSLILCMFVGQELSPQQVAAALTAATSRNWEPGEVTRAGERIVNLQRLFNLRCGATGADDRLPPRLLTPTPDGSHAGRVPDLARQLEEYYRERGWDADGVPGAERLEALGLGFALPGLRAGTASRG